MGGLNWRFICLAIHISAHLDSVNSLTCLSCDSVAHPRLCTHVTKCFPGEKCGMDTFISQDGDLQYRLGCVDTNTCSTNLVNAMADGHQYFSCHRCCDDHDLCNVRGCNSTGFPTNRGPICYDCEAFPEGYPCHKITHCETHEVCYNEAHLEFQSDILYSSGCRSKHHCAGDKLDPMSGIGRRSVSVCTDCCQGDLCNIQCKKSRFCSDDSTCQLLMASYDVCKSPDIAKQFCQKSCNLCATSGMTCTDTRLDCAYIANSVNMCGTLQTATNYGCLKYCGYCSGSTGGPGSMYSRYTTSSGSSTTNLPSTTTLPQTMIFNTSPSTVFTKSTTAATNTMPPPRNGDQVIRGPDWHYGNQDGNGTGTIIDANLGNGWVQVYWANTGNAESYRYGTGGIYEVQKYTGPYPSTVQTTTTTMVHTTFAPGTVFTTSTTAATNTMPPPRNGDHVIRGPDWHYGNQDGNGTGTIIDANLPNGWVQVYWANTGNAESYRYGTGGIYEVQKYTGPYPSTVQTTTTTIAHTTFAPVTLVVGEKVVRGPDWTWQTQDSNGTGTVVSAPSGGWVRIKWDKTGLENSYRYGDSGKYDVKSYPMGMSTTASPTTVTPASSTTAPPLSIGDVVVRGPDWNWQSQDGNGTGTVIDVPMAGWVVVRWNKTGVDNAYRYGESGAYDVKLYSVGSSMTTASRPTTQTSNGQTTRSTTVQATTTNIHVFRIGDRVVRGPDWRWGDQDNNGIGTVIGVDVHGWVTVRWDNNFENVYRNGVQNAYDLQKVGSTGGTTTSKPPTTPPTAGPGLVNAMYVGARVQRGIDWRYGTQDGNGPGTVRALPPKVPSGWVQVEWDNGYLNNYRLGIDNAYDVMLVPGSYNPPTSG